MFVRVIAALFSIAVAVTTASAAHADDDEAAREHCLLLPACRELMREIRSTQGEKGVARLAAFVVCKPEIDSGTANSSVRRMCRDLARLFDADQSGEIHASMLKIWTTLSAAPAVAATVVAPAAAARPRARGEIDTCPAPAYVLTDKDGCQPRKGRR